MRRRRGRVHDEEDGLRGEQQLEGRIQGAWPRLLRKRLHRGDNLFLFLFFITDDEQSFRFSLSRLSAFQLSLLLEGRQRLCARDAWLLALSRYVT